MTSRSGPAPADLARELEADAAEFPEDRGEALLEAATQWRFAGDHARAECLLNEVVELGGEDGAFARVVLADHHFADGRDDDARVQLAALQQSRPRDPGPCQQAGELLEERGDLVESHRWFTMAAQRLTERDLAVLDTDTGWASYAAGVLGGRRRVRGELGMAPDELDMRVPDRPAVPGSSEFEPASEPLDELDAGLLPAAILRTLFWPRGDLEDAIERWPALRDSGADPASYHSDVEGSLRALAARSGGQIELVPGTADSLARFSRETGADPTDSATRERYMNHLAGQGRTVDWPPSRNDRCWCASGRKYKQCCGRAS